jgi:hypothetical protein
MTTSVSLMFQSDSGLRDDDGSLPGWLLSWFLRRDDDDSPVSCERSIPLSFPWSVPWIAVETYYTLLSKFSQAGQLSCLLRVAPYK